MSFDRRVPFFSIVLFATVQVILLVPSVGLTAETRKWTDTTGRFSIRAELLRVDGETAVLKGTDGRTIEVPLARLSPADRAYARQHAAGTAGSKPGDDSTAWGRLKRGVVRKLGSAEEGYFLVAFWGKEVRLRQAGGGGGGRRRRAAGAKPRAPAPQPAQPKLTPETLMTCGVEVIEGRDATAEVIARFVAESPLDSARGFDTTRLQNPRARLTDFQLIARFDPTPAGRSEAEGFRGMFNKALSDLRPASFSGLGGPVLAVMVAHLGQGQWATDYSYARPAPSAAPPIPRGARKYTVPIPRKFNDFKRLVPIGFGKDDGEQAALSAVSR